jgi:DNA-binding XRE family transcriptional regulator
MVTAKQYQAARRKRGTQQRVADLLGVHQVTIARRETGALPVSEEAWRALLSLPEQITRPKNARQNDRIIRATD